jgi:hypothetical protein
MISLRGGVTDLGNVSFIKSDIEGAEKDMILGARKLLTSVKPKLAISIYHRKWDILEIPLLIHDIEPTYRLKIRHHSDNCEETVLYCF